MKTKSLVTGSCECGRIRFVLTAACERHAYCDCEHCAPEHDGSVRWCTVAEEQFRWLEGQGGLARIPTATRAHRVICTHCERTLYYDSDAWPGELHVALERLDAEGPEEETASAPLPALRWCPQDDAVPPGAQT